MIHGGVDGFSRMLVFLSASTSNAKEVVAGYFLNAVAKYGLPSRIRVDHGGENNEIVAIMEAVRGPQRGSAIQGRSVHNQRIERSWRDLWHNVSHIYHELFTFLEERGLLNVELQLDLWALHYVFVPRINRDLEMYREQWNRHGLRTEHHMTPMQLFVSRSLALQGSSLTANRDLFGTPAVFESAWENGPETTLELEDFCPLQEQQLASLKETINPLEEEDLGIETFLAVKTFVNTHPTE